MKIQSLRIVNYKSFQDSGWLDLDPHFTVIVGANNVGKTALVEAFRLGQAGARPHRSVEIGEDVPLNPHSDFHLRLNFTGSEVRNTLLSMDGTLAIPIPEGVDPDLFLNSLFAAAALESEVLARSGSGFSGPTTGVYNPERNRDINYHLRLNLRPDRAEFLQAGRGAGFADSLPAALQKLYYRQTFVFDAQRFHIGKSPISQDEFLRPDGSNLPSMIFKMNKNPFIIDKYNEYVRFIFPEILRVTVSQTANEVEIFLYDTVTTRSDLAISLADSGAGVSQVLAIIQVLFQIPAGIVVIDEPNSFLHPGAAKKLMQVLQLFPHHQYVVTTHSPEVIAAAEPRTLILLNKGKRGTALRKVDASQLDEARVILEELGSSLSDVFGQEAILWVEGATEKECFPKIIRRKIGDRPLGLAVVAMRNTGDFDRRRRDPREIWELYDRVSNAATLVPKAVAFSFDREGRTETQIADMERASKGAAKFLGRRMFENFLLHPAAISAVLSQRGVATDKTTVAAVEQWLADKLPDYVDGGGDGSDTQLERHCNAARLLYDLFVEASDATVEYAKLRDSVAIFDWLLEYDEQALDELAQYLLELVPPRYRRAPDAVQKKDQSIVH